MLPKQYTARPCAHPWAEGLTIFKTRAGYFMLLDKYALIAVLFSLFVTEYLFSLNWFKENLQETCLFPTVLLPAPGVSEKGRLSLSSPLPNLSQGTLTCFVPESLYILEIWISSLNNIFKNIIVNTQGF